MLRDHGAHVRAEAVHHGSFLDDEHVRMLREHRGERHLVVRLEEAAVHDGDDRCPSAASASAAASDGSTIVPTARIATSLPVAQHFPRAVRHRRRSPTSAGGTSGDDVARIAQAERTVRRARRPCAAARASPCRPSARSPSSPAPRACTRCRRGPCASGRPRRRAPRDPCRTPPAAAGSRRRG